MLVINVNLLHFVLKVIEIGTTLQFVSPEYWLFPLLIPPYSLKKDSWIRNINIGGWISQEITKNF